MLACALALGFSFLFPAPQAPSSPPLVRKLNGPLLRRGTRDVTAFRLSPDGTRAFYLADVERDETRALLGVPADGSGPAVQLSPSFGGGSTASVDADFQLSRDGASVAFRMSNGFSSGFHLYAVPAAGGPLALLDPGSLFGPSVESGYRFSSDGTRVIYLADRSVDNVLELWSAATDGLTPPVRLNGALPAGGRVLDFAVTPDGTQALYRADQSTDELFELFVVPVDGSAAPRRLNPNLVSGGDVAANYRVDPLGKRVVYVADQEVNNTFYLYSVPLDGSAPAVRLMPTNTSQNFEPDFVITGDGQRVAYRFFSINSAKLLLFSAPIAGPAAAVPLTDPLGVALPGVQPGFRAGPGGEVLFRASTLVNGAVHLYSVPASGATQPARLDGLPDSGAQVLDDFRFSADGTRALFRALESADPSVRLFSAPHDGAAPAVELAGPFVPGGNALLFQERDGWVTYLADQECDEVQELYQVPADGSAPAQRLTDALPAFADAQSDYQLAPGGRTVVYRADERRDEDLELFRASPGSADLALNPPFPSSTDQIGPVGFFLMAGERVVFTQQMRTFGYSDLLSVPLHGGGGPVILNPPSVAATHFLSGIRVSPDQQHVVYTANQDAPDKIELYAVPIDGNGPCVKKNGPLVARGNVSSGDFLLSADGRWIVYLADQRVDQQFELFSAPLAEDGEAKLLTPMRTGRNVAQWRITPDSRTVLYIADQDFDERYELYSVPIDGSGPSVRIGTMQNAGGSVSRFECAGDSQRVVYLADQLRNDQFELFVTRADGLAPSRVLNLPLTPKGDLRGFQITSDLGHVLYMADKDAPGVVQLFSVPLSGSSALGLELTPPLTRATDVVRSYLTPDGAWAFYVDTARQLWSVPVAGGSPARMLDGNFPDQHGLVTYDLQATPDSKRVLYRADPAQLQRWELFSVPVAGGAPPVRLHPPLIRQRRVELFGPAPGGRSVGFTAALEADGRQELYLSPADGSAPPRKMNARLVSGGSVESFAFGATENEAVYLADQDTEGALELYLTTLPEPGGRVHPR